MTKKEMEKEINELYWKVEELTNIIYNKPLSIANAKQRDYIVRTNYIGRIKDKKIKDDFKKKIEDKCGDNFDSITNKLLNYEFYFENKNILDLFSETLQKFEYKQIVLDTYGDKKSEK